MGRETFRHHLKENHRLSIIAHRKWEFITYMHAIVLYVCFNKSIMENPWTKQFGYFKKSDFLENGNSF